MTGDGSHTHNWPTTTPEPGIVDFDTAEFAGSNDDETLNHLMTYAAAQTYKPTIRLRHGLTTLTRVHTPYTGFKLVGAGGPVPVEQIRTGQPYASRVNARQGSGRYVFDLPPGQTHGMVLSGFASEGTRDTSWLGSTHGGVLWTSVLRDLSFSAFYSVLGKSTQKLLNTAIMCDGYWNTNNSYHTAYTLGGSDSLFWCGSQSLLDSPTTLNPDVPYHMVFDWQEKSYVGPGPYITAEGNPGAIQVKGSRTSGGMTFMGVRMEGRNSNAPTKGHVLRVDGGVSTFRDCWIAYATDPVKVNGGEVFMDGCCYSLAATRGPDDPFLVAAAGSRVRIRNMRTVDDGGMWGTSVPVVKAEPGATIDADNTVRIV